MSYVWGENTNITNAKKCLWWCVYKHNWEHYAQQLYSISKCWVCACCTSYTPQPSYCTILRWRLHFAVGKKKSLVSKCACFMPMAKNHILQLLRLCMLGRPADFYISVYLLHILECCYFLYNYRPLAKKHQPCAPLATLCASSMVKEKSSLAPLALRAVAWQVLVRLFSLSQDGWTIYCVYLHWGRRSS